jgi:hypothetical protein
MDVLSAAVPAADGIPGWVYAAASALAGIAGTVLSGKVVVPTFSYQREVGRADRLEAAIATDYVPKVQFDHEQARANRLEAEVRELNATIRGEVMTVLIKNTDLVERQSEELVRLKARRSNS